MVKNLIKKIFKSFKYNALAMLNVILGFLFAVYLVKKFGIGKETDIYFLSMLVITYMGYFIQAIWEAFSPYYIELKQKNKQLSNALYSVLLNDLILLSLVIIILYFLTTMSFDVLDAKYKNFLDIVIFNLIFQNILFLNKGIINLEHNYALFYIVDILINIILLIVLFFSDNFIYIAYAVLLASILANILQFYVIFIKFNINYIFSIYQSNLYLKNIYKNSVKLKIGSLMYGYKDIAIASIFTAYGTGFYSIFSYASKFSQVILQIINAPMLNIFATESTYLIVSNKLSTIESKIRVLLSKTAFLYTASSIIIYFMIPFVLDIVFNDKFNQETTDTLQGLFFVLSIINAALILASPYGRLITIFKGFNALLILNLVFFIIILIGYGFFRHSYQNFLYAYFLAYIFSMSFQVIVCMYLLKQQKLRLKETK